MSDILFIGYKRCGTSNKAEAYLKDMKIDYDFRDMKEENPSEEELKAFYEKSGLDIKRFFNTSGKLYKENGIKDKLADMTLDDKIKLLSEDGMMVKRPILIQGDKVLVGFKESEWKEHFENKVSK